MNKDASDRMALVQQALHDNARSYGIQASSLEQDALRALFTVNAGGLVALVGYIGSNAFASAGRFGSGRIALLLLLLGTGLCAAILGTIFSMLGRQGREVECEEFAFWLAVDAQAADDGARERARELIRSTGHSSMAATMVSMVCFLLATAVAADAFSPLFAGVAKLLRDAGQAAAQVQPQGQARPYPPPPAGKPGG